MNWDETLRLLLCAAVVIGALRAAYLVGHRRGAREERELAARVIPLTPQIRRRR